MFDIVLDEATMRDAADAVGRQLWQLRSDAQLAMAQAFESIVLGNFGEVGIDRPISWAPLSPAYAKKVGRTFATLEVSGALKAAVTVDNSNLDYSRVFITKDNVVYALAHQYGNPKGNLPARPYFPIENTGELTPFAKSEVMNAALQTIQEGL